MEIPKSQLSGAALRALSTQLGERGTAAAAPLPLPVDRSSIKALDLPAALQILSAELRLALTAAGFEPPDPALGDALQRWAAGLSPDMPLLSASAAAVDADVSAPLLRTLLQTFLRALPADDLAPQAWVASVQKLAQAIADGSAAAAERVAAWRDTPASIPALLERARTMALSLIADQATAPMPIRPLSMRLEWLGIGEAWGRFHRLRRRQRRLLLSGTDADWLDDEAPLPLREPPAAEREP